MMLTPYQAKYIASELTKRCGSDSAEKLTGAQLVPRNPPEQKLCGPEG
jgi:hypothetical protein